MTVTMDRSSLDVERTICSFGMPIHGGLDGVGDELLHLHRRHARTLHSNNDLVVS